MIELVQGNLFEADVEAITNAVNCIGVMGKGIALEFKKRFPQNFLAYKAACDHGELQLGRVFIHDNGPSSKHRYIVNFPTKHHWRDTSRLADIRTGLETLAIDLERLQIHSIALPALGCGLGGLDWMDVRLEIAKTFATSKSVKVLVFSPLTNNTTAKSSQKGNFSVDPAKRTTDTK